MNTAELRAKPTEELESDLNDLEEGLFSLKFRNVLSQLDDTSQLKKTPWPGPKCHATTNTNR